jgi:hypothetical protein
MVRKKPNVGDIVWIKEANTWGRTGLPPGPIRVKVLETDDNYSFEAEPVHPDSTGDDWWNYKYTEIFTPVAKSRKKGKFIGKRVIQNL